MNEPNPPSTFRLIIVCGTVVIGGSALVAQYNAQQFLLQKECMGIHGNWESRGGGDKVGCRFPIVNEEKKQ